MCAEAVRRFVVPVARREVVSVRGGSELFRVVNNPLADLAFAVGVGRLTGGKLEAVFAALLIPGLTHLHRAARAGLDRAAVPGRRPRGQPRRRGDRDHGLGDRGARRASCSARRGCAATRSATRAVGWLEGVNVRALLPFFGWFAALAAFDVLIQGLASLAFGVPIPWTALVARIPIVYIALSIPSVGNFGVRETVWAALFAEYGSRDALIAYAFATNSDLHGDAPADRDRLRPARVRARRGGAAHGAHAAARTSRCCATRSTPRARTARGHPWTSLAFGSLRAPPERRLR